VVRSKVKEKSAAVFAVRRAKLYPQEERGIQRAKYSGFEGEWQCSIPHHHKAQKKHKKRQKT
jgi:hypothetical protein